MKVKSLSVKDFNQFKDFELDLTYPAGHAKAGLPLDKVCIIGQSGTGKTSLLLFLKKVLDFLGKIQSFDKVSPFFQKDILEINFEHEVVFLEEENEFRCFSPRPMFIDIPIHPQTGEAGQTIISLSNEYVNAIFNGPRRTPVESRHTWTHETAHNFLKSSRIGYLYYPTDLINSYKEPEKQELLAVQKDAGFMAVDLSLYDAQKYWNIILENIQKYQEVEIQKRIELSQILQNPNISLEEVNQARQKFDKWLIENFNPLEDLADNFLDDILKKFNLRTRKKLSFNSKEDLGNIKIETLQGVEVPLSSWSTGTKHLIFSILPLYGIKPEKKLLLFDEPERSLYPDIQTEIIDVITNPKLSTDCQFFFATHSPLIASCFEPWEIVELKFKPDGTVYRELYYDAEKGNHVDNYTIDPRYLRWDSILTRLFDLDKDSNEARTRKLMELASLRSKLEKSNGKISTEEKQKLYAQFEKLAELLDWEYDAKN